MAFYEIQNVYEEHISVNDLDSLLCNDNNISDYYFILHDKDLNSFGETKKPHYHICVCISLGVKHNENETYLKGLFSFTKCRIKCIRSLEKFLRYLTHRDNKEKYQYNDCDVYANDKESYFNIIENRFTSSASDLLVGEFCSYVETYIIYDKSHDISSNAVFKFFRDKGKLNYYLSHIHQIETLTCLIVNEYVSKLKKNGGV